MKIYETRKNMCLKDNILKDKYGIYSMQLTNRKNFIYLLKIIAISLPVIFLWWLSIRYGVNVISREDVLVIDEFIDIITSGKIDWNIFFGRNNEHLIVFPKIIIFLLTFLFFSSIIIIENK